MFIVNNSDKQTWIERYSFLFCLCWNVCGYPLPVFFCCFCCCCGRRNRNDSKTDHRQSEDGEKRLARKITWIIFLHCLLFASKQTSTATQKPETYNLSKGFQSETNLNREFLIPPPASAIFQFMITHCCSLPLVFVCQSMRIAFCIRVMSEALRRGVLDSSAPSRDWRSEGEKQIINSKAKLFIFSFCRIYSEGDQQFIERSWGEGGEEGKSC